MRRLTIVLVVLLGLGVVYMLPAFSEPARGPASCGSDPEEWGFDLNGRRWECESNWLVRVGPFGVGGI